jgi:hypothetical protein
MIPQQTATPVWVTVSPSHGGSAVFHSLSCWNHHSDRSIAVYFKNVDSNYNPSEFLLVIELNNIQYQYIIVVEDSG